MKKIFLIRSLVVLYFILFVCTKLSEYYMVIPKEAEEYNQTVYALFNNPFGSIYISLFGFLGYALELIGLVATFSGRYSGIYWLLVGTALSTAISVVLSNPNSYPFLQSELTNLLFGGACASWGALIVVSLTSKAELQKAKA